MEHNTMDRIEHTSIPLMRALDFPNEIRETGNLMVDDALYYHGIFALSRGHIFGAMMHIYTNNGVAALTWHGSRKDMQINSGAVDAIGINGVYC